MADNHHPVVDPVTGRETTGHVYDGIAELNTPLPRWWLWSFYACIVFSIGYWVVYPSWPLVANYTAGTFGWTSRGAVTEEVKALVASRAADEARLASADLSAIRGDADLLAIAAAKGRTTFADNCAPCHGTGGGGAVGYPNLADDDWLWGGSLDEIATTINHGIRSTDPDARIGDMPAFGRDGTLDRKQITDVAGHVLSLAGQPTPEGADIAAGAALFAENCAGCHGDTGAGMKEMGAPNLTDAIWLYGSAPETVVATITNGRAGVMPAWSSRFDEATIKSLVVYVHSFGGGQ